MKRIHCVLAPLIGVTASAFVVLGAGIAHAGPDQPVPGPGPGGTGTRGSLTDQPPANSGNSGWAYLPNGTGAECEDAWIKCGSAMNPAKSDLPRSDNDAGGWVSDPGGVGPECNNPGTVCTDVS